jgi:hypothetical protein
MQRAVVEEMLDELGSWASAMQSVRQHSAGSAERPV